MTGNDLLHLADLVSDDEAMREEWGNNPPYPPVRKERREHPMDQATPRPWQVFDAPSNFQKGRLFIRPRGEPGIPAIAIIPSERARDYRHANAALIVAAVNSYDTHKALVEAALLVLGCHPVGSEFAQFDALEKLRQALKAIDLKAVEETDK